MATPKTAPTVTPLAAQRAATLADIAALQGSLAKIDADLILLGPGRYADETGKHVFQVIAATLSSTGAVSYALPEDGEEEARQLAGDKFGDLFERTVVFTPCKGFALVIPKLLTPAKARDLVALCEVPGKVTNAKNAYVKEA